MFDKVRSASRTKFSKRQQRHHMVDARCAWWSRGLYWGLRVALTLNVCQAGRVDDLEAYSSQC